MEKDLTRIANIPTVIITEQSGAMQDRASINFVEKNGRLSFKIDKSNTRKPPDGCICFKSGRLEE